MPIDVVHLHINPHDIISKGLIKKIDLNEVILHLIVSGSSKKSSPLFNISTCIDIFITTLCFGPQTTIKKFS